MTGSGANLASTRGYKRYVIRMTGQELCCLFTQPPIIAQFFILQRLKMGKIWDFSLIVNFQKII